MKFLADENLDVPIVEWLWAKGFDVLSIRHTTPGISDREIMALAVAQGRIIITNDLDFGELVYQRGMEAAGVILVRVHPPHPNTRLLALQKHWDDIVQHAGGNFLVVTDRKLRMRPLL